MPFPVKHQAANGITISGSQKSLERGVFDIMRRHPADWNYL